MSKQVNQSDLRRMMAKIKTGPGAQSAKLKKYKLSAREQMLLEQERQRKERKAEEKRARAPAPLPADFFEKKPAKSILKNSGGASASAAASTSSSSSSTPAQPQKPAIPAAVQAAAKAMHAPPPPKKAKKKTEKKGKEEVEGKAEEKAGSNGTNLPEGFFDDPRQDAKARNIEYKNPADEEWNAFQKEISAEIDTAQDLVSEDREESTVGRQIDEIDDQMRAWSRVSHMEKKLTQVEERVHEKKNVKVKKEEDESGSDDDDAEMDLFDWRKKS